MNIFFREENKTCKKEIKGKNDVTFLKLKKNLLFLSLGIILTGYSKAPTILKGLNFSVLLASKTGEYQINPVRECFLHTQLNSTFK